MKFLSLPLFALVAQQALAIALPINGNEQLAAELEARHQHIGQGRGGKFGGGNKGGNFGKGAAIGAGAGAIAAGAGAGGKGKGGSTTSSAVIGSSTSAVVGTSTTTTSTTAAPAADIGVGGGKGGKGGASTSVASSAVIGTSTSSAAVASVSTAPPPSSDAGLSAAQITALQTSLNLDKSQVQPGLAQNGQAVPEAGQVPSLTSTNNFINFCATQQTTLTNGLQTIAGSCNPTIMGRIIANTILPSSKFTFPPNFGTIAANESFNITMAVSNMVTGNFVAAATNYYAAPCQVDGSGTVIGHSHFVVEKMTSLTQTTPTDPLTFAFFKGVNSPAVGGILTEAVTGGLPAGTYRLASINTCANHQPVLASVAQHGHMDDMIYFTAK